MTQLSVLLQLQAINMKKVSRITYLVMSIIFLLSFLFIHSTPVYAQSISLSLSPPLVQGIIKPGKSILVAYTIRNGGDPAIVVPNVLPFRPGGKNGQIVLQKKLSGPLQFKLQNDANALDEEFLLQTGKSMQLLLEINVPQTTPENDYYYSFLISTKNPQTENSDTTSIAQGAIGSNIILTVSKTGESIILPTVETFSLAGGTKVGNSILFDSFDKIPVELVVKNNGKNMFSPQGNIQLKGGMGGRAIYTIIPQNVLSHSIRKLIATPSAQLATGNSSSLNLSGFFIGGYDLSATLQFGVGTKTLYAQTKFFAFPFKLSLAVGISILIFIFIRRRLSEE